MTFITQNHPDKHPDKLPPLYAYPAHVDKVLKKPTRKEALGQRVKAALSKILKRDKIALDKSE